MTKTMKMTSITLTTVIVLSCLGYFGLRHFTRSVYSQRTCEWANIDNIELHTRVDIPKIITCDCEYQKEQNTKMARFDIDKDNVDMDHYVKVNKFKKLDSKEEILFDELLNREDNPADLVSSSDLYFTKGNSDGETWQTLLDYSTGRLWVTINYVN
jgi:hypothetical protein